VSCRAVLFDLFETLLESHGTGLREKAIQIAQEVGVGREAWVRGWRTAFDEAARGHITSLRQRVAMALTAAGVREPDPGLVDRLVGPLLAREWCRPYPDVRPTITELRARGYRVALLSNITADERHLVEAFGLAELLDALVLSCDLGAVKPEAEIYVVAAESLSLAPSECAFVDDRPSFVMAAKAVGMAGVCLHRPGGHREEEPTGECDLRIGGLSELLAWLPPRAGEGP